jgi:hypothetical protein
LRPTIEESIEAYLMDLKLEDLTQGMTGMTGEIGEIGATLAQAAAVCFDSQRHEQGAPLMVRGSQTGVHHAFWSSVSKAMRDSWDDPNEATEFGAAGVAVLLADKLFRKKVTKRARIGTGFDYWLGEKEENSVNMFENTTRLEVSGIRQGDDLAVDSRVNQKLKQTSRSDIDFPAIVIVVEFGKPQAKIATT